MDNFLTQTFCIKNHPICKLKDVFRLQYLMGLGEFMFNMSKKDVRSKLIFEVWARSIMNIVPSSCWHQSTNFSDIKIATSFKRDGLHFFSMRRVFFFDCLYLVSKINPKHCQYAFSFLQEHVGVFSKFALKDIYINWDNYTKLTIPTQLLSHRKDNETFNNKPIKTILVVATMTAGKSTLINALMGCRINKVETTACTNRLHFLYNKPKVDGVVLKRKGTSYQYCFTIDNSLEIEEFDEAALHFNSSYLSNSRVCFIDTPGVNYSCSARHREITYQAIKENNYDVLLYVSNSNYFGTDDELELLNYIFKNSKKSKIFVLNKMDTFKAKYDSIEKMIKNFKEILLLFNCQSKVFPVSAEAAFYSKQSPKMLDSDEMVEYEQYKRKFDNNYYDLPFYCEGKCSNNFTDRTGITLIEKTIKNIIQ